MIKKNKKQQFAGLQKKWEPKSPFAGSLPNFLELMEDRNALMDEADAILAAGEKNNHKLSKSQTTRWEDLLAPEHGEIALLDVKLQATLDRENAQKQAAHLALLREDDDAADAPTGFPIGDRKMSQPAIRTTSKLQAFHGPDAEKKAYGCGMWLRAVIARHRGGVDDAAEVAALGAGFDVNATATEGTDSAGGYTVPDPLAQAIIEVRERVGVSRPLSDIRTMTADTLRIPVQTAGPTVTYPGEASAITPDDSTWGQVNLTAVKRAILSKISNELQADAIINITDQAISRMGYEFAKQEDNEFILGDGTAAFGGETGLLAALGTAGINAAAAGNTNWDALVLADFTTTMGILPSAYTTGAESWVCSNAFYYEVMVKLLTEAGGNTLVNLEAGTGSRPTFLGKPVFLTDRMPTTTAAATVACLYGSFRDAVIIGDRTMIQIMMSTDRYFEEDVIALRAIARYDILVHDSGDASDAGAYVGLATA